MSSTKAILDHFRTAEKLSRWLDDNIEVGEFPYVYEVRDRAAAYKALQKFRPDHGWARNEGVPILFFEHEEDLLRFKMTV